MLSATARSRRTTRSWRAKQTPDRRQVPVRRDRRPPPARHRGASAALRACPPQDRSADGPERPLRPFLDGLSASHNGNPERTRSMATREPRDGSSSRRMRERRLAHGVVRAAALPAQTIPGHSSDAIQILDHCFLTSATRQLSRSEHPCPRRPPAAGGSRRRRRTLELHRCAAKTGSDGRAESTDERWHQGR